MCTESWKINVYRLFAGKEVIIAMDLSVHTIVVRNRISKPEAEQICRLYGKSLSNTVEIAGSDIKIAGINQINLKGMKIPSSGIMTYDLAILVNAGRLIGKANLSMLIWDKHNADAVVKKLSSIFTNQFFLKTKHCNAEEWYIKRIDCGMDLKLCTDEKAVIRAFIKALHDSFDSNNSRGIQYETYKGYDAPEVQYESLTLETAGYKSGNPLYRYNIYYKLQQMEKYVSQQSVQLSTKDISEIKNIVRIEKQIDDVAKIFGCSNKLKSLLNEAVTQKIMIGIVREIKLLFGKGDYLTYDEAIQRIYQSGYGICEQNKMAAIYAYVRDNGYSALLDYVKQRILACGGTEMDVCAKHKEIFMARTCIETLGISIASIHNSYSFKGISTLVDEAVADRAKLRKKSAFGKIKPYKQPNGKVRYQSNVTLYSPDGSSKRHTLAGKVGENYDEADYTILCKLREIMQRDLKSLGNDRQKKIEYLTIFGKKLCDYQTIKHCPKMKGHINSAIEQVHKKLEELKAVPDYEL